MSDRPIISIKPHNPNWYPPCFESQEQHKDYMWRLMQAGRPADENNYCMDCTREYKVDMLKAEKCSHPETIFVTWRTTYKQPTSEGKIITTNELDVIGISNVSRFWDSPLYD